MPVSPFHFGYTCAYCGRFFPGLNRIDLLIAFFVLAFTVWMLASVRDPGPAMGSMGILSPGPGQMERASDPPQAD